MSVTKDLLELFRVDKQLRGLRSRLESAERFLSQQSLQLAELDKQKVGLESQLRQLRATAGNEEGEGKRLDDRIGVLRDQMNSAKTSKEYTAFQTELNNLKELKGAAEERALESMSKVDEIDARLAEIRKGHEERTRIVAQAKSDRDTKEADIRDRVQELSAQRAALAEKIPARDRTNFENLVKVRGDEAMAPIEVIDRRNHEYSCSACSMTVPMEIASGILSGKLVHCPNCRSILYTEDGAMNAPEKKSSKSKKKDTEVAHKG